MSSIRLAFWVRLAVMGGGLLSLVLLAGCASRGGGDFDDVPPHIARIPDAVPKVEPKSRSGNPESYVVFGKTYRVMASGSGYRERGLASWYGKPFHGRPTSSGEIYDMHGMSAAHKTLPLPTYARVTNLDNGRSVVIRINDRGPFHDDRVIDLSHTAAVKLGVVRSGTARVEVRAIDPRRPRDDPGPFLAARDRAPTSVARAPERGAAPERRRPAPAAPVSVPAAAVEAPALAARTARSSPLERPAVATSVRPSGAAATQAASRPPVGDRPASARLAGAASGSLYLQVGAFGDPGNAERLRARLAERIEHEVRIQDAAANGARLYRVRIGPLASQQDAQRLLPRLAALGVSDPKTVGN